VRWAVDTNVLVRLLVRDDADQHAAALGRLLAAERAGDTWWVGTVALAETAWVLGRVYRYPRHHVAEAIAGLLAARAVEVEAVEAVLGALDDFRRGAADFPDYLILRCGHLVGAERALTFDQRLLAEGGCERP
jgi:predicted nucleic-acid-binding protein